MSAVFPIFISLCLISMISTLPQDQNYIRTQRKISQNNYNQRIKEGAVFFPESQNQHLRNRASFGPRAEFASYRNDVDYDDVESPPLDFKPVHSIETLGRVPPKVDRREPSTQHPQRQPAHSIETLGRVPPKVDRKQPSAQYPRRPAHAYDVQPTQSLQPVRISGSKKRNHPKQTKLSDCGKANLHCCRLAAYHSRFIPKCFENMGCEGGYYDSPCSPDKVHQMNNYLNQN